MKRILGTVMPVVLLVQLALTVALVNKASAQSAGKDPDNENQRGHVPIGRYSSWLESLGPEYEVVQGEVFLMTNTECPKFVAIFDSCFGQNPAAPYIIPQPPIEVSYVDPDYATTFNTPGPHHQTANIFYRLGDQDALVTIVSYPPKAAYFIPVMYSHENRAITKVFLLLHDRPPFRQIPIATRFLGASEMV